MQVISYWPETFHFSKTLHEYFVEQGFSLLPYNRDYNPKMFALVLMMPVKCENKWVDYTEVWRRYLANYSPGSKLFRAVVIDDDVFPNAINFLNLPENLQLYLNMANPLDNQLPELYLADISVQQIWSQFWSGHNQNGFMYYFGQTNRTVTISNDSIISKKKKPKQEMERLKSMDLVHLIMRCQLQWSVYESYWENTPFYLEFGRCTELIHQLNLDLSGVAESDISVLHTRLVEIDKILRELTPFFV